MVPLRFPALTRCPVGNVEAPGAYTRLMPAQQVPVFAAALVLEVALLCLALTHARSDGYPNLTRWATRVLITGVLIVSPIAIYEALWEITNFDYPWTSRGRPFGTYEQPTSLGVGLVALHGLLFMGAGILAFFRARLAIGVLAFIAITGVAMAALWLTDATAPRWNWAVTLVIGPPLPALTLALLLWSLRRPLRGGAERGQPTNRCSLPCAGDRAQSAADEAGRAFVQGHPEGEAGSASLRAAPVLQLSTTDRVIGVHQPSEAVSTQELILWPFLLPELVQVHDERFCLRGAGHPYPQCALAVRPAIGVLGVQFEVDVRERSHDVGVLQPQRIDLRERFRRRNAIGGAAHNR